MRWCEPLNSSSLDCFASPFQRTSTGRAFNMAISEDAEKKLPLETANDVIDHEHAQVYKIDLAEEKRVRWKIDMVVLPMASCLTPIASRDR